MQAELEQAPTRRGPCCSRARREETARPPRSSAWRARSPRRGARRREDLDLRSPQLATALGVQPTRDTTAALSGRGRCSSADRRSGHSELRLARAVQQASARWWNAPPRDAGTRRRGGRDRRLPLRRHPAAWRGERRAAVDGRRRRGRDVVRLGNTGPGACGRCASCWRGRCGRSAATSSSAARRPGRRVRLCRPRRAPAEQRRRGSLRDPTEALPWPTPIPTRRKPGRHRTLR